MLGWHMNHGQSGELSPPSYDKEAPMSHIPQLASGHMVSGDLSAASPGHFSMPSPGASTGVNIRGSREFASPGFGNVAWREMIDGWKIKQEKGTCSPSISHAPSEGRFANDIDANTEIDVDDPLLNDETCQPLSRKVFITSSRINL